MMNNQENKEVEQPFDTQVLQDSIEQVSEHIEKANNDIDEATAELEKEAKTQGDYDLEAKGKDLYQDIIDLLVKHDFDDPDSFHHGRINHEVLKEQPMSFQRMTLNRALRLMFNEVETKLNVDTREHRYTLLEKGSYEQWKEQLPNNIGYLCELYKKIKEEENITDVPEEDIKVVEVVDVGSNQEVEVNHVEEQTESN